MVGVEPSAPRTSDLKARTLSAIVMVAVSGTALMLGGFVWMAFVGMVALGVLWEWIRLARRFTPGPGGRAAWNFSGMLYVGIAASMLLFLRNEMFTLTPILTLLLTVIAVDVGAYFTGRTFRGPKIAPAISPSKTWSGLIGGALGATLVLFCAARFLQSGAIWLSPEGPLSQIDNCFGATPCWYATAGAVPLFANCLMTGILVAVCAQAGDFFESWMKRRAGMKDSGNFIPGHGGFFDRADGLMAVLFMLGLMILFQPR